MISLFRRKAKSYGNVLPITVDMHSHLLPGIDDGCKSFDESIALIKELIELGYKKLICTPHIMGDFYRNTPEIILGKLDQLTDIINQLGLDIELGAAAEYYLDESFVERIDNAEELLCFGKEKYVLFETSYMNASPHTENVIFMLQSLGYTPVLAHPERYVYLFENYNEQLHKLHSKGVLFQININSLSGYYSRPSKKIAEYLIDEELVSFLGTDMHGERHFKSLVKSRETNHYKKALSQELLNNKLLEE
ncbi:tyrosine-protein phosphatase [Bernardetia sp.]|uniref:tyrosine-protein phosphatase n=1 Tax=Bernardetia sp. TaxID=1937974 RepID=UPI0025BE04DD|nr:CpsB/CapC family capsule biosynthesis tyrosine phosphatase [Bernardetia sp.]